MATPAVQAPPFSPTTTGVLAITTAKPGVTPEQVMPFMPDEIRATVRLYLDGTIRQWYSRGDGRGVVFLLNAKDTAEAHAIMEAQPIAKGNIVDHEYIPVGPLMPLRILMAGGAPRQ